VRISGVTVHKLNGQQKSQRLWLYKSGSGKASSISRKNKRLQVKEPSALALLCGAADGLKPIRWQRRPKNDNC
jgi:hypothetical protein